MAALGPPGAGVGLVATLQIPGTSFTLNNYTFERLEQAVDATLID